jgi:hypothetical protein
MVLNVVEPIDEFGKPVLRLRPYAQSKDAATGACQRSDLVGKRNPVREKHAGRAENGVQVRHTSLL